jgi:hypothetical protein
MVCSGLHAFDSFLHHTKESRWKQTRLLEETLLDGTVHCFEAQELSGRLSSHLTAYATLASSTTNPKFRRSSFHE